MFIIDNISSAIFAQDEKSGFRIGLVIFVLLTIRAFINLKKTHELHKFFISSYLLYLPVFIMGLGCALMIYVALFLNERK